MIIGRIPQLLDAATDMPWAKDFAWWKGKTKASPATVASVEGRLKRRECGNSDAVLLTVENGRLVIFGNKTGVRLSEDDMSDLAPGVYDLEVTVTLDDGAVRRVIVGLNVVAPL